MLPPLQGKYDCRACKDANCAKCCNACTKCGEWVWKPDVKHLRCLTPAEDAAWREKMKKRSSNGHY